MYVHCKKHFVLTSRRSSIAQHALVTSQRYLLYRVGHLVRLYKVYSFTSAVLLPMDSAASRSGNKSIGDAKH